MLLFLGERVRDLCHDGRHGRCRNQRERLGDPGGEEGPVKRICNGELLQEEEVHAVGVAAGLTLRVTFKKNNLKKRAFARLNSPAPLMMIILSVLSI